MKKRITALFAAMIFAIAMVGCSSNTKKEEQKNVATADIVSKIKEEIEIRVMGAADETMVKDMFHVNMDDVEEITIERGMINTGLETIAVAKAKSGKAEEVKKAFEKVKEEKKQSAFYPGESEAVEASEIKTIGDYVGFFIIPDYKEGQNNSKKAVEIFEEALK